METFVNEIIMYLKELATTNNQVLVIFLASLIIIIESIIPVLPLALFITLNMVIFGSVVGFIISWIATVIGCVLSFYIFRKGLYKYIYRFIDKKDFFKKIMSAVDNLSFSKLLLITAMPFTPAFSVNIACGLSKISFKKYLIMILISKLSVVYFWGFIGTTLIESLSDVTVLFKIFTILFITHLISLVVRKYIDIN